MGWTCGVYSKVPCKFCKGTGKDEGGICDGCEGTGKQSCETEWKPGGKP